MYFSGMRVRKMPTSVLYVAPRGLRRNVGCFYLIYDILIVNEAFSELSRPCDIICMKCELYGTMIYSIMYIAT